MEPFKLFRAKASNEALTALSGSGTKIIAGGTNLVDLMKLNIERPKQLIDINALALRSIKEMAGGMVRIGSLVTNSDIAYHPLIIQHYPVLSEALLSGASAQLRNRATTGGNLLQRTRCPYFYNTDFACNKRVPGSGCSAIPGYNRNNAILGTSEYCIAAHPSDMCVAMAALEAVINVQGPKGERTIPFAAFHLLPGSSPEKETALRPDELITSVDLPAFSYSARSHYVKVRDRASYEFALTSAAVALDVKNGKILGARVALGGVGTKPWRSPEAEKVLTNAMAGKETFQAAAEAALKEAKPFKHNNFKIELAKRTLVRALSVTGGMS